MGELGGLTGPRPGRGSQPAPSRQSLQAKGVTPP